MAELKEPTTYEEQIVLLRHRGCIITDENKCREFLGQVRYYRISAYFLPFKNGDTDKYLPRVTFEKIMHIYDFDRRLRHLIFAAIEDIEIYLRSALSYYHAHKYGAEGYLNGNTFSSKHNEQKFKDKLIREIENNKNASFVNHHIKQYDGRFPLWVACELFSFGMLSYFYSDLKSQDAKILANELYHNIPKNIKSWLRCCTDLRNICAHYGRLYYRKFSAIPAAMELSTEQQRSLFGAILALRALHPCSQKWNNEFLEGTQALLEQYEEDIVLKHIGFPDDWVERLRK